MLDVSENDLGDEGVRIILDAVARMVHEARSEWYSKRDWHTPILDLHGNRTRGHFVHHVQKAEEEWVSKFPNRVSACFLYAPEFACNDKTEELPRNQCHFRAGTQCVHSKPNEGRTIHVLLGKWP